MKGKDVSVHAMKRHRKVQVSFNQFLSSALDGMNGQHHVPAALFPVESPLVSTE
jgi:hypothetical protein